MKFYNVIDEQGRFKEVRAYLEKSGQVDTHTVSYLYAREQRKELLGLDKFGLEVFDERI